MLSVATNPALVAHLYRRAGFGATPAELDDLSRKSWTELVDGLLAGLTGPGPAADAVPLPHLTTLPESNVPGYYYNGWQEYSNLVNWWLGRMVVTDTPLREKLTLLLHCQFPTSITKVGWASMMYAQNHIFRTLGAGNFETLVQAVAKDPAMLIWLDTDTSHRDAPNQNFARELMERFTMGIGNYTQEDVIQGARAFTGWELDTVSGGFFFNSYDHDNGVKHFLGRTGRFMGEDIVHIVTNEPASHRWVISRLWTWLAYPVTPSNPIVQDFVHGYAKDLNVTNLLDAMFNHPAFVSPQSMQGLVKQPIELLVGALRVLGLTTAPFSARRHRPGPLRPAFGGRLGLERVLAIDGRGGRVHATGVEPGRRGQPDRPGERRRPPRRPGHRRTFVDRPAGRLRPDPLRGHLARPFATPKLGRVAGPADRHPRSVVP